MKIKTKKRDRIVQIEVILSEIQILTSFEANLFLKIRLIYFSYEFFMKFDAKSIHSSLKIHD